MTSSLELETRHYWRTRRALAKQRRDGATPADMSDNLDEFDTLVRMTASPRLRALCVAILASVAVVAESTAAEILPFVDLHAAATSSNVVFGGLT